MTATAAELAETYLTAWKARDFDTLRSILADEVTFTGPLARIDSADDCITGLRTLSQTVTDIVVHKRLADNTDAMTWFDLHTAGAPPLPTVNWTRAEAGKITHIQVTFDPRPLPSPVSDPGKHAMCPDDLTGIFVAAARRGDTHGMASVYADDAVLAFPPDSQTVGRDAIRSAFDKLLSATRGKPMEPEDPMPTLICGDIALTSTQSKDNKGIRVQVARRQPNGSWLRIIDRPGAR